MALDSRAITNALASHAASLGYYETVNTYQPHMSPHNGLSAAVWLQRLVPVQGRSGLNRTSALLVFILRQYMPTQAAPKDSLDENGLLAMDALITAYSGDFTLGGIVAEVDLLGAYGQSLEVVAGYDEVDGEFLRVMDLMIPLVINDCWEQAA